MVTILETSAFIRASMSVPERRMFAAIKRDILSELVTPRNSDLLLVDVLACEYIKYARALTDNLPRIAIASAKALREFLGELNLTPKSRLETNTASTLSTIFKILNKEEPNAEHSPEI